MTISVRAGSDGDDVRAAIAPIFHYFGLSPPEAAVANFTQLMTPARVLVAQDGVETVGGCGSFPLHLTTPGGHVQACGVSMVGVMPTHRRRGVLSGMMHRLIEDCRTRDEPVAYLWPSEERIYGRFGFGLTGLSGDIQITREHAAFGEDIDAVGRIRHVSLDASFEPLNRIFALAAGLTPGAFARDREWWERKTLADPTWLRQGGGEMQCVVLDIDGVPSAYALYRMTFDVTRGVQGGATKVIEAVGASPQATMQIWRFLLSMDWTAAISASYLPLDHPLILSVAEPRRLNLRQRDGAWLRLVDLGQALGARAYGPGEIVLEVSDTLCPWNAGRWLVREGGATRTKRAPELRCDVAALACVYLGGFTWRQLVASSRAFAESGQAVVMADRVFETHGAPWCPEIF